MESFVYNVNNVFHLFEDILEINALYEYSKATGKANPAAVERFLNLAS